LGPALDTSFRARGGFLSEPSSWSLRQAPCALFGRILSTQRRRTQNDARKPNDAAGSFEAAPLTEVRASVTAAALGRVTRETRNEPQASVARKARGAAHAPNAPDAQPRLARRRYAMVDQQGHWQVQAASTQARSTLT